MLCVQGTVRPGTARPRTHPWEPLASSRGMLGVLDSGESTELAAMACTPDGQCCSAMSKSHLRE